MRTKKWATLLAAFMILVLAVGCAKSANPAPSSAGTEQKSDEGAKQQSSSNVTIAYAEAGVQTMDPHEAADLTSASYAIAAYDQLVTSDVETVNGEKIGRTDKIVPMLADSWKVSDDLKTYTFVLHDGVKFASGNPVNADAVVFSFERAKTKGEGGSLYQLSNIETVTKVDDKTVEFKLSAPNHLFLKYLATFTFSIVDPTVVKEKGDDYLTQHTAGSGAYQLEKWDPSTEAVFAANKDYWRGAPKAGKITVKYVKEASNRVVLLQKGDVDIALDIPAKEVEKLKQDSNLTVSSKSTNRIYFAGMNANFKPFDNLKVRQAIAYSISQEKLIQDVVYGQASPLRSSISSKSPAFTDEGYEYKYDLDKAKQLLKEAGLEKGFSFDLTISSATQDYEDIAVLWKADLEKIGVTLNIKKVAAAQYREILNKKSAAAYLGRYTSLVNDPSYHYGFLLDSKGASNYAAYSSAKVDDLLAQANKEPDEAKRNELYKEVQKQVTADTPWVYLYESNLIVGMNKSLQGYVFFPDEIIRFSTLSK